MAIKRLGHEKVQESVVNALGLDATCADLETPEILAALIRRAASFLCPVTPRALIRSVEEAIDGLVPEIRSDDGASVVRAMLDNLVAYGDLVEAPVDEDGIGRTRRLLFLAQPSYVMMFDDAEHSGNAEYSDSADPSEHLDPADNVDRVCLLVGVRADGVPLLGDERLTKRINPYNHARQLPLKPRENPEELFLGFGIRMMTQEQWLNSPQASSPEDLAQEYATRLDAAGSAGSIEQVRILDTSKPVTYYRGRWREPTKHDTGAFITRHSLQFAAEQWGYSELLRGSVVKFVELPISNSLDRACDVAWRLQAAIDVCNGTPQVVRVHPSREADTVELKFLSPIPSWAQRRLDAFGHPLGRRPGCLFSYKLPADVLDRELGFLRQAMWITTERRD